LRVFAKLSARAALSATGTLPENVNYASTTRLAVSPAVLDAQTAFFSTLEFCAVNYHADDQLAVNSAHAASTIFYAYLVRGGGGGRFRASECNEGRIEAQCDSTKKNF
jgi:hypothetical protein